MRVLHGCAKLWPYLVSTALEGSGHDGDSPQKAEIRRPASRWFPGICEFEHGDMLMTSRETAIGQPGKPVPVFRSQNTCVVLAIMEVERSA